MIVISEDQAQRVQAAEQEATQRIALAAKRASEAERAEAEQSRHIADSYEKQNEAHAIRQVAQLEDAQTKGYQQIRDAQRAQQVELQKIRREGESSISTLDDYYRRSLNDLSRTGTLKTRELQSEHGRMMEYEIKRGQEEDAQLRRDHDQRLSMARENAETQILTVEEQHKAKYDELKKAYGEDSAKSQEIFEKKFSDNLQVQGDTIDRLNARAGVQINQIRQDTAAKLAAYNSRQDDPFYKLIDLDAHLTDEGDSYRLTLELPSHEKSHVNATIKGENIVVTGYRSNKEELVLSSDDQNHQHVTGTSSYQTFRESFPLDWPVDAKNLMREDDGDRIVFRVPKKGPYAARPRETAHAPEKLHQSRPHFPANLEASMPSKTVHSSDGSKDDDSSVGPRPRKAGSGTIG